MHDVIVAGVGMTQFRKDPPRSLRSLAEEAAADALAHAGIGPDAVDAVFFGNSVAGNTTGQETIRGQASLRGSGLLGLPIYNLENACASGSTAFNLACMAVGSGQYDVAIAVGAEKLTFEGPPRIPHAAGGVDVDSAASLREWIKANEPADAKPREGRSSLFMDIYAVATRQFMRDTGTTAQDFADVSVKNHAHGTLNAKAQYGRPCTREEVLASRMVAEPLTVLMCSPLGDGAAAAVVCTPETARRIGVRAPVRVAASVVLSGRDKRPDEPGVVERAVRRAYEMAGVGPSDLDCIELHDAAAPAELILYEQLGLCARGEAAGLLASGRTTLGGRTPVNTSGGLLSKGHPVGATGIAQIAEVVWQLRGEAGERQVNGARVGLTENAGGFLGSDAAAGAVHVLVR